MLGKLQGEEEAGAAAAAGGRRRQAGYTPRDRNIQMFNHIPVLFNRVEILPGA